MDEEEFEEEFEEEVELEEGFVFIHASKGSKWGVLAATMGLFKNLAASVQTYFFNLQVLAEERAEWQNDRQRFFENTSKTIERLTAAENEEVTHGLPDE